MNKFLAVVLPVCYLCQHECRFIVNLSEIIKMPRLSSIEIENFKSIRDRIKIQIKPITLLFGANSAGKSSILQALNLVHEIIVKQNLSPKRLLSDGNIVDIGNYWELVHNHDLSKPIAFKLNFDIGDTVFPCDFFDFPFAILNSKVRRGSIHNFPAHLVPKSFIKNIDNMRPTGTLLDFSKKYKEKLSSKDQTSMIQSCSVEFFIMPTKGNALEIVKYISYLNGNPVAELDGSGTLKLQNDHVIFNDILNPFTPGSDLDDLWGLPNKQDDLNNCLADYWLNAALESIKIDTTSNLQSNDIDGENTSDEKDLLIKELFSNNDEEYCEAIDSLDEEARQYGELTSEDHYSRCESDDLDVFIWKNPNYGNRPYYHKSKKAQSIFPLLKLNYQSQSNLHTDSQAIYGSLLLWNSFNGVNLCSDTHTSSTGIADATWESTAFISILRSVVAGPLKLAKNCLEKWNHLGSLRSPISRKFTPQSYDRESRWSTGLAAWDILYDSPKDVIAETSKWLGGKDGLDLGYLLTKRSYKEIDIDGDAHEKLLNCTTRKEIQAVLDGVRTYSQLWFVPVRNKNLLLTSQDVGTGISQTLPVIVAALEGKDSCFSIEESEQHLHPKAQVRLGDLFIQQSSERKTFLLETHSEHLLLRLLRRVRETHDKELPEESLALTPNELSIYYVEYSDNRTVAYELKVTQSGDSLNRWPEGFFEERFGELF